jgi:DNA-binding Lrp family transcriptional regulator
MITTEEVFLSMPDWTIISNHGLVLNYLWENPRSTARAIASVIKTTEWTARKIIAELEEEGYIERQKAGRNNVYRLNPNIGLRHHTTRHVLLGNLLEVLAQQREESN